MQHQLNNTKQQLETMVNIQKERHLCDIKKKEKKIIRIK